ncbi:MULTISPECIES: hypothetical protein [unclassified Luteimonas]
MDACRTWRRVLVAGLLLAPLPTLAGQPAAAGMRTTGAGDAATAVADADVFGRAVADEALSALRGGDGQATVEVDNQGTVDGNTASHVVAGDNRIDGGAFANAAGLTTVIQNSGSNVLIQNGTAVNVRFGSGP